MDAELSKKEYAELKRLTAIEGRPLTIAEDSRRRELEVRLDQYGVPEGS